LGTTESARKNRFYKGYNPLLKNLNFNDRNRGHLGGMTYQGNISLPKLLYEIGLADYNHFFREKRMSLPNAQK
jgi:hypothetical protein